MDNTGFTDELFGIDVVPDGETAATHVSSAVVAPELSLSVNDATRRATIGLSSVSGRPRQLPNVRACVPTPIIDYGYGYEWNIATPVDGAIVAEGERVLLPYQNTATERGLYRRSGNVFVRDSDTYNGLGHQVFVESGTRFGGKQFVLHAANTWRAIGGPDYYARVPVVYNPIEVWDADSGVERTAAGIIVGWRGLNGTQALPISSTMTLETTLFGGRNAVNFNGTTGGLRAYLGQYRRTGNVLAMYVQLVATENTATWRQVCELSNDGGATAKRLELLHPAATNRVQCAGNSDDNTLLSTTGWGTYTEMVLGAVRVAGTRLELFRNGVSLGSQADTTSGQPIAAADLIIGHSAYISNGAFFLGSIRRIAVYNVAHDDAEAAAIDAAWRGY